MYCVRYYKLNSTINLLILTNYYVKRYEYNFCELCRCDGMNEFLINHVISVKTKHHSLETAKTT